MNNQRKGLIAGALLADAFALGPHWIYDTSIIEKHFAGMDEFRQPLAPYHKGKEAGDFTHYGDQTLHLLKFIVAQGKFDLRLYKDAWMRYVEEGTMYMDHASKDSLEALAGVSLVGSTSDELGGLVRNAALYYLDHAELEDFINQNNLTHNNPLVNKVVQFYFEVVEKVLNGTSPSNAIEAVKENMKDQVIDQAVKNAEDLLNQDSIKAIASLGQACPARYGLPASIYLILKYEGDYIGAMKANVMAGGDSASRGMIVGMVLGGQVGYDGLPKAWLDSLNQDLPL